MIKKLYSVLDFLSPFPFLLFVYFIAVFVYKTYTPDGLQMLMVSLPVIVINMVINAELELLYVRNLLEYYRYYSDKNIETSKFNIILKRYKG